MKLIYILIIILIILIGFLAFLFEWGFGNPKTYSCEKDADCVLAYIGMEPCAPCDDAHSQKQCISPEKAEKLQKLREKKHGMVLCDMCPPPKNKFKCVCENGICSKVENKSY